MAGAFHDRGLVLTGVTLACRPAGAGWEADLRVGEAVVTCRLPRRPPAARDTFVVTAVDPPYFDPGGNILPAGCRETDPRADRQASSTRACSREA
jgi:hypothetical protein